MGTADAAAAQRAPYELLGKNLVTNTWDGAPVMLYVNLSVNMPQTPNGSMVFTYQNFAVQNNRGTLALTSGGGPPSTYNVDALANQPSILIKNWQANNLTVTNISANDTTPILIQAVGPGMPGIYPATLPIGTPLPLLPGQTAQTNAQPQWMQLMFQNTNGQLAIFVVVGGPPDASGNNAYVISVNASSNTGPNTGVNPPAGYYATTSNNSYVYTFNWGSSLIFVANLSGSTSTGSQVVLRAL